MNKLPHKKDVRTLKEITRFLPAGDYEKEAAQHLWESVFSECVYRMTSKCEEVFIKGTATQAWCGRCDTCEAEHKLWREGKKHSTSTPNIIIDGMDSHVRNARMGHEKDTLQPLTPDGTLNKHFVQAHGTKSIRKEMKLSKKEIHANIERYG